MPTFTGTGSADTFTAPDDQDWIIIGKSGADVLTGGGGDDIIDAGKGNDVLDGGGGDDIFLVGVAGGTDIYIGGDTAYVGATGYDSVKAVADNVKIGIASFTGIEEFSADGHIGVSIIGSAADNVFDFSNVTLTGIVSVGGGRKIMIPEPGQCCGMQEVAFSMLPHRRIVCLCIHHGIQQDLTGQLRTIPITRHQGRGCSKITSSAIAGNEKLVDVSAE